MLRYQRKVRVKKKDYSANRDVRPLGPNEGSNFCSLVPRGLPLNIDKQRRSLSPANKAPDQVLGTRSAVGNGIQNHSLARQLWSGSFSSDGQHSVKPENSRQAPPNAETGYRSNGSPSDATPFSLSRRRSAEMIPSTMIVTR